MTDDTTDIRELQLQLELNQEKYEQSLESLKEQLRLKEQQLNQQSGDAGLKQKIIDLSDKLSQLTKEIATKDNTIQELNKQLKQQQSQGSAAKMTKVNVNHAPQGSQPSQQFKSPLKQPAKQGVAKQAPMNSPQSFPPQQQFQGVNGVSISQRSYPQMAPPSHPIQYHPQSHVRPFPPPQYQHQQQVRQVIGQRR